MFKVGDKVRIKSELERMKNTELWVKLYPLLLEFSSYFK